MLNHFCKVPLWEASRRLTAVALGKEPADLVIRDARLVNVCTAEILEHTDVAVALGRVALVGDAAHCIGPNTKVIDARGATIAPGFLDGHIHIESSMMSVGEYARAVIPHGTVGVYMDPHEICNVLGARGVRLMIADSKRVPLKTMVTVPSCVPAMPDFEDSGAKIDADDIREMMTWPEVVGLGEVMNYPGLFACNDGLFRELEETLRADKTVTGHYPEHETGGGLNAYIAAGVRCCHESTRPEDALVKMRLGMYAQVREGSAWQDLHDLAPAINTGKVDTRYVNLVTDDAHPNTLLSEGHLDRILRRALEEGIDPVAAIQMVTINTAACFGMDHELGSITPGKCADIVFLESLDNMRVTRVLIDGDVVAEDEKLCKPFLPFAYPDWATDTMHDGVDITQDSFR
ncbi:MAG: amidohydrolase family protein, partial [Firmicutes bacterium]|nr:amidohydrolase family protein [Bacillota bacterium]